MVCTGFIETTGFFSGEAGNNSWRRCATQAGDPGDYGAGFPRGHAELASGRLAVMTIIGLFFQDGVTGSTSGDWSFYTDSHLRAFESELGMQAPVSFWDPAGFAKGPSRGVARRS